MSSGNLGLVALSGSSPGFSWLVVFLGYAVSATNYAGRPFSFYCIGFACPGNLQAVALCSDLLACLRFQRPALARLVGVQ